MISVYFHKKNIKELEKKNEYKKPERKLVFINIIRKNKNLSTVTVFSLIQNRIPGSITHEHEYCDSKQLKLSLS